MSASAILRARKMVTEYSVEELQAVADKAMSFATTAEVEDYMRSLWRRLQVNGSLSYLLWNQFYSAWQHLYVLSGLVLVGAAVWLYIRDYIRTGNLIHLRGLFCLFFEEGREFPCFKLSYLQTDWLLITWIQLFLAVYGILVGI